MTDSLCGHLFAPYWSAHSSPYRQLISPMKVVVTKASEVSFLKNRLINLKDVTFQSTSINWVINIYICCGGKFVDWQRTWHKLWASFSLPHSVSCWLALCGESHYSVSACCHTLVGSRRASPQRQHLCVRKWVYTGCVGLCSYFGGGSYAYWNVDSFLQLPWSLMCHRHDCSRFSVGSMRPAGRFIRENSCMFCHSDSVS